MALINDVWNDVEQFLRSNSRIFFNERELQLVLASYIDGTKRYSKISLECLAPAAHDIKLDIVVEGKGADAGKYVPIELKYRTRSIAGMTKNVMGKSTSLAKILKDQSAQDLGRYGFWNDVRRLEDVKSAYPAVDGGIALLLTNDSNYVNCPKSTSAHYNYEQFSMTNGVKTHLTRNWLRTIPPSYPNFNVRAVYTINWCTTLYKAIPFYYCMLKI